VTALDARIISVFRWFWEAGEISLDGCMQNLGQAMYPSTSV